MQFDPREEALNYLAYLESHIKSESGECFFAVTRFANAPYFLNFEFSDAFEQFCLIQARVPILRFKDSSHLLEVDLNWNNCVGIRNTHLLYCYSQSE